MVAANSDSRGAIRYGALKRELDALAIRDPALATQVTDALRTELGPIHFGRVQAASYTLPAKDGGGLTVRDGAPSVRSYFEGTANRAQGRTPAERASLSQSDRAFYARMDRLWGDGNPSTFDGDAIQRGINDLISRGLSFETYERTRGSTGTAALNRTSRDNQELLWDLGQLTLDVVGIFDPTGLSDGANALISAGRGDWVGAGLSLAAVVPIVGALATAGKLGKWAETVAKAVDAAANNPAARQLLEPALRKLSDAINAIPDSVMRNLPDEMRTTLEGMKAKLDGLFGAGARVFSDAVVRTAERLGIPPAKVQAIIDAGRGNRPDPSTYMSRDAISQHLAMFDDGAIRFGSRRSYNERGTLGPPGGFVMSWRQFEAVMEAADGDLRKVEVALGLEPGYLDSADTMVAFIERSDMTALRMPSGNEGGANPFWLPGGFTSGGVAEAVMDFPPGLRFKKVDISGVR